MVLRSPSAKNARAKRRLVAAARLLAVPLGMALLLTSSIAARTKPLRVWFAPGPGTLDMVRLFETPEEWPTARARVGVFKFYQGQLQDPAPANVGPNTYRALRAADAFRILTRVWHKRVAIEVGAVKEHYCTADNSGMNRAIVDTLRAVAAVRDAGGEVNYLALDEPFLSGTQPACGGPDPAATVERLERYFANVHLALPEVAIGLIEPYPYFSTDQLLDFVRRMAARGIRPAFFHVDVDLWVFRTKPDTFDVDMPRLLEGLAAERVPLGVIVWGHDGDSDSLYYDDALSLVRRVDKALPELPQDVVFQSWAVSKTGQLITPTNLPEWGPNTHTALIDGGLELLRRPETDAPVPSNFRR